MSQPLTTTSPIIESLFGALGSGWSTLTLNVVLNDINGSPTLLSELSGMQNGTSIWWKYIPLQPTDPKDSYISGSSPTFYDTAIAPEVLTGSFPSNGNQVYDLLTTIAYEAGHAEDPQFYIQNGNGYLTPYFLAQNANLTKGSDLQFGAEVALQLLGEGKSLYNDELVATQRA